MVSCSPEERSRAQLILVGAVAIAFIVMGLVVVFNTILYTENVASSGGVSEPREAQRMKAASEAGSRGLVHRVGTDGNWTTQLGLETAIEENASRYSGNVTNVTADRTPAFLEFDVTGVDQFGVNLKQKDGSEFVDNTGARNWTAAVSGAQTGGFEMTVDVDSLDAPKGTNGAPFRLVWESDDSSGTYTVWLYRTGTGANADVVIQTLTNESAPTTAYDASEECVLSGSGTEDNVTIDFQDGEIEGYPVCSRELGVGDGVQYSEERSLKFLNGTKAAGDYSLVVDQEANLDTSLVTDGTGGVPLPPALSNRPYYTWAAWSVDYTVTYESSQVTVTETYVMEVYNRTA